MSADEVARVLRIVAKHVNACADELSDPAEEGPMSVEDQLAEAKRAQAERHSKLTGRK